VLWLWVSTDRRSNRYNAFVFRVKLLIKNLLYPWRWGATLFRNVSVYKPSDAASYSGRHDSTANITISPNSGGSNSNYGHAAKSSDHSPSCHCDCILGLSHCLAATTKHHARHWHFLPIASLSYLTNVTGEFLIFNERADVQKQDTFLETWAQTLNQGCEHLWELFCLTGVTAEPIEIEARLVWYCDCLIVSVSCNFCWRPMYCLLIYVTMLSHLRGLYRSKGRMTTNDYFEGYKTNSLQVSAL